MNATMFLLAVVSPLFVALLRRCSWPEPFVAVVSFLVIAALYVAAQFVDQTLSWPPSSEFWEGLAAAWAVQQATYKLALKHSPPVQQLEKFNDGS